MARSPRTRVVNGPIIKPREPGRLVDLARLVGLGALLALPAFLYAGLQAHLLETRRTVVDLEGRLAELEENRRRLDVELAALSDPREIEDRAREQGLRPREQDQVAYLTPPAATDGRHPPFVAEATGGDGGRQRP